MTWLILSAAILFVAIVVVRLLAIKSGCRIVSTDLRLTVPDLPSDRGVVRIAFLSDLHVGRLNVPADELVATVDAARPDLLLLGGDYSARPANVEAAFELMARLSESRPTFAVLGNTDYYQRVDRPRLREILRPGGGDLLMNEVGRVRVGEVIIEVLGVDDPLYGSVDVPGTAAAAGGDAHLRIGLCHSPEAWQELAELDAHITLFGHTHGGQVRIPGLEAHLTHQTYPRELAAGLFRYEDGADRPRRLASHWEIVNRKGPLKLSAEQGRFLYVTRGMGMSVTSVRVMCPPELLVIEVRREDEAGGESRDDR